MIFEFEKKNKKNACFEIYEHEPMEVIDEHEPFELPYLGFEARILLLVVSIPGPKVIKLFPCSTHLSEIYPAHKC